MKLPLPDSLAKEAAAMVCCNRKPCRRCCARRRSRRVARLAEARKRVAAAGIPPITMEEIQVEIKTDRAEWHGNATR